MIISHIDRLPNGTRIIDSEKGEDVYYLNKCPYCNVGQLRWIKSTDFSPGSMWAISCYNCEASTDFFPSKFDALENKLERDW